MDEDTIRDLKQFIATTVTQQIADVRSDIQTLDNTLSLKIEDLSKSVAEAIESNNEATDKRIDSHEHRITRLEHKIA